MIARIILVLAVAGCIGVGGVGCGGGQSDGGGGTVTVFAAASLTEAFGEMADAFMDANSGVAVRLHFAGSQTLRTQLEQGARADVFAPADWRQMASIREAGLLGGVPVYFAANRMAVAVPASHSGGVGGDGVGGDAAMANAPASGDAAMANAAVSSGDAAASGVSSLVDLANPGVAVALATEETPAGVYAWQSVELMGADAAFPAGFAVAVRSNVVTRETSVRAVVQKVALGEVDAGLIYETDAAQYADAVRMIEIPLHLNPAAQYPIATLDGAAHPAIADAFVALVLSDLGQGILRRHGFAPAADVACPCADVGVENGVGGVGSNAPAAALRLPQNRAIRVGVGGVGSDAAAAISKEGAGRY